MDSPKQSVSAADIDNSFSLPARAPNPCDIRDVPHRAGSIQKRYV